MSDYELAFGRRDFLLNNGWRKSSICPHYWVHDKFGQELFNEDQAFQKESEGA
jgi:hypothetical protein